MPRKRPYTSIGYLSKKKVSIDNLSIGKKNSFANVLSWSKKFKEEISLVQQYKNELKKLDDVYKDKLLLEKRMDKNDLSILKNKNRFLENKNKTLINEIKSFRNVNNILKEKIDEVNLCGICYENKINILCSPCNHICICEKCHKGVGSKCPMCREDVKKFIKVYI